MATVAAATQAGVAASHPYTCNTCHVAYRNPDLQKGHMKSDWHRYNLKRRVSALPPISAEAFTEKVLQARAQSTAEADKAFFERVCDACEKTYYSENSFQNHLLSQKHRAREAKGPQPAGGIPDEASSVMSSTFSLGDPVHAKAGDDESLDMAVEEEFNQVIEGLQKTQVSHTRPSPVKRPSNPPPAHGDSSDKERDSNSATPTPPQPDPATLLQQCLFCRYQSPTVALNAHHMERFHGMVIPEKDFLVDLDGLVKHLSSKVYEGLQCLSCGKAKANAFAVQTHMRDVGHCTVPFTTEREQLDIGDFYDFRSTYSDDEEDEDEDEDEEGEGKKEKKLGVKRSTKLTHENGEVAGGEDDGWETDSSASSTDSEELTAVHADQPERHGKSHHHLPDGWHSHAHKGTRAVFYDDYELHLPSGKSVGHRSLNKYYRQNLQNYPTPEERAERLALENGEEGEGAEGEDGTVAVRGQNKSRAVIPRGEEGVMGITDEKRQVLRRDIRKGRDAQHAAVARKNLRIGQANNNQKGYYYRYDGGG